MPYAGVRVSFASGLLCFALSGYAQQPAGSVPPADPGPALATLTSKGNSKILLDVVVTDKSGKPVAGLQQQDFTVQDNKRPSAILSFKAEGSAVAGAKGGATPQLFLIMDGVNTEIERVMYERESIKQFLTQNHGKLQYPVSLAFFTEDGMQIQTHPSRDGNALIAAINQMGPPRRLIERSSGIYGSEDLLRMSLDALTAFIKKEGPGPGRKIAIWLSPGWPFLNAVPNSLTPNQKQRIFKSVVGYSTALRQAQITLYSVDPQGATDAGGTESSRYQQFVKGLTKVDQAEIGDMGLQVLATQTGGRVIIGNDSLLNSINHFVADLSAYYEVTIESAKADPENPFHEIDVKVDKPGLTARTRMGYYTQQ